MPLTPGTLSPSAVTGAWCGVLLAVSSFARAEIPAAERQALTALYQATGGEDWIDNSGWSEAEAGSECSWHGVVCDAGDTHVQKLALARNGLDGELPPTLNRLSELNSIALNGNTLRGAIPSLEGLRNLDYVDLSENQFSGPLPRFADLRALVSFSAAGNHLSGPIPALDSTPHLQFLDLSHNQLDGPVPRLDQLRDLKLLSLSRNRLTGSIPPIAGLPLLHDVFLTGNQLSGAIPELSGLPELRYLRLDSNQLSGPIPSLAGVPNLQELLVQKNRLTGSVPTPPEGMSSATLCPNPLDPSARDSALSKRWSEITRVTPWWRDCTPAKEAR